MERDNAIVEVRSEPAQLQNYNGANPIGAMLNAVVEKGISTENVAAMKELVGLYERMEDRGAKQAFTSAMTALQSELPKVVAKSAIPGKDGTIRSTFANYETIMDAIEPYLNKHGFSVSFTIKFDDKRLIAVCRMRHAQGHEESNEFGVRIGNGPPGCSEAQADGAARSYARRGALCDALNIVVDHDDDARVDGSVITPEQAKSIRDRAKSCGADEGRLLRFANADTYEEIRATKFAAVDEVLRKKEQAPTTAKPKPPASGEMSDAEKAAIKAAERVQYDLSGNQIK